VSTKEGISVIAQYIQDRETHLDILMSNAGIIETLHSCATFRTPPWMNCRPLFGLRGTATGLTFTVNVTTHHFLSVALLKLLAAAGDLDLPGGVKGRDQGRGVVLITSSCASMHNCTNVDLTSYAASKAAIDHLVALLASKFARWYVRVNAINPGCK
jgi:NAD(P)-dependent dehydrogenase (short-subunit alcohol dehydrogenase family)